MYHISGIDLLPSASPHIHPSIHPSIHHVQFSFIHLSIPGISPIVTAGMVMQLLAGSQLIHVDQSNRDDRLIFNGIQKLLGLLMTLGEAVAYVMSGAYGDIRTIGAGHAILIILQLFVAGTNETEDEMHHSFIFIIENFHRQ